MSERDPRKASRDVLLSLAETGVPVHPDQARRLWAAAEADGDEEFEAEMRAARERCDRQQARHERDMAETRAQMEDLERRARGEGFDL